MNDLIIEKSLSQLHGKDYSDGKVRFGNQSLICRTEGFMDILITEVNVSY